MLLDLGRSLLSLVALAALLSTGCAPISVSRGRGSLPRTDDRFLVGGTVFIEESHTEAILPTIGGQMTRPLNDWLLLGIDFGVMSARPFLSVPFSIGRFHTDLTIGAQGGMAVDAIFGGVDASAGLSYGDEDFEIYSALRHQQLWISLPEHHYDADDTYLGATTPEYHWQTWAGFLGYRARRHGIEAYVMPLPAERTERDEDAIIYGLNLHWTTGGD